VERFEDLTWHHEKTLTSRSSALIRRMDLRNNLLLLDLYLPQAIRAGYRRDWIDRYVALARQDGHLEDARNAIAEARLMLARRERKPLRAETVEAVLQPRQQEDAVRRWAQSRNVRQVVIADYSKNLRASFDACVKAGLKVIAIADNNPAFAGKSYRGTPIVPDAHTEITGWQTSSAGGIVLSNVNPAQVDRRLASLSAWFSGPILRLWHPKHLALSAGAA